MTKNMLEEKRVKLAGLFRQIRILIWKNLITLSRNKFATLVELFCPLFFSSFLLVIRHFIERIEYKDYYNVPINVFNFNEEFNVKTRRYVLYYPNNPFIKDLVTKAMRLITAKNPKFEPLIFGSDKPSGLDIDPVTVSKLLAFYSFPTDYSTRLPDEVQYTIFSQEDQVYRYKIDSLFPKKVEYLFNKAPESFCHDTTYFTLYNSFNTFKFAMDLQLINNLTSYSINNLNILKIMSFKCPDYAQDDMKSVFGFFTPLLISVSFMFTALVTIGNIVGEKSTKLKEYLKLIGIKYYAMWFTWWIRSIFIYLIISLYVTIITRILFPANTSKNPFIKDKSVFMNTNAFIFLLFMLAYSVQVATFTILVSQLFSKTFSARIFLVVIWLFSVINFYDELPTSVYKYFLCALPNLGLNFGIQVIFQYERSGQILGFNEFYQNLFDDPLNLGSIISAMIIWSIIYLPITWYLEKVYPGDYGIPLPFYFPITANYWFPQTLKIQPKDMQNNKASDLNFEREPFNYRKTVNLYNLSKTFTSFRKTKMAVKNVSINFYENQVTGLLGHNGAGKTTLTYMLSGLYSPTSGSGQLMGYDLRNDCDKIRSIMGYCPQIDILIDNFNVKEHLKMIAMIKGFPKEKLEEEIERISKFVGLNNDLKKYAKNLSGGMKRRLMVAMALIGDSKIIILDEPTSGLDPFNRVKLWELIRKYKTGRTIILTTHFMEEADALSDRIAIMNHGEIKCCGSPIFLKNRFGQGFQIRVMKQANFEIDEFLSMIDNHLNDYKVETNVAAEINVSVSFEKMKILPNLLSEIEKNKNNLKIDSYSISSSTIEEVFLKVGKIDQNNNLDEENDSIKFVDDTYFNAFKQKIELNTDYKLWLQQIKSLLIKRFIMFYRRFFLAIITLLLPVLFQGLLSYFIPSSSILINNKVEKTKGYGSLQLDITSYGPQELTYYINNPDETNSFNQLIRKFYSYSNRPAINLNKINSSVINYVENKHDQNLNTLLKKYFVGLTISARNSPQQINSFDITAHYSKMAYHSISFIVSDVSNIILAYLNNNNLNKKITTYNTPLLPFNSRYSGIDYSKYIECFDLLPSSLFNFSTSIIIGFVISILVMHVSKEKMNGSKKLQLLSNTHNLVYWLSHYIFDLTICLLNISLLIIIILIMNSVRNDDSTDTYLISSSPTLGYFYFCLFISCLNWPLYAYCWSLVFKTDISTFVVLLVLLGMASLVDVLFFFIQIFIHINDASLTFGSSGSLLMYSLRIIFCFLFPNITIKRELFNFRIRNNNYCLDTLNRVLKSNLKYNSNYLDVNEPGVGFFILISVSQFILCFFILVGIETQSLNKESIMNIFNNFINANIKYLSLNRNIDSSVQKEIIRIKNSDLMDLSVKEPLIVNQIVKLFKKSNKMVAAVDNLSFGVKAQKCFGLLGLNGAGKTTTFKIIVGDLNPNQGDVLINGLSIQKDRYNARQNLGYCPQFDCLPEYLTVKETIYLFAKLRGIPNNLASNLTMDMLEIFQLNEFEKVHVQNLSGGNKRKVSCAVAFIGKPSVVILDEPSTGMDPGARKFLWKIIKKARDLGITIVLSSHSMEECEALCDKLSIMINGQLQCFDSISMLKKKFGEGLRLIIKCKHSVDYKTDQIISNLENFIFTNFPTATLEDKQYETLFYNIRSSFSSPQDTTSLSSDSTLMNRDHVENLSQIFSKIEENKEKLNIESYYLSETTLEQVFMSFANKSKKINEKNQKESKLSQFKNKAPFSIISQKMFNLSDDGSNLNNKSSEDDAHLISYKSIGQFNDNFIDLPVKSEYQF